MIRRRRNHGDVANRAPRAFTLVEMLVSLAVLAVALTVVGYVFSITVSTTRQAAAYSEAQNLVQQFANEIEEDLRNCDPSNSVLVMVGRTQAAARTNDDLKARKFWRVLVGNPSLATGYNPDYGSLPATTPPPPHSDPRADILMFFSNRETASQAPPSQADAATEPFAYACLSGAKFSPIEVVYGHAALDTAVYGAGRYDFSGHRRHITQTRSGTVPTEMSELPVTDWHLSRRATIFQPSNAWPPTIQLGAVATKYLPKGCPDATLSPHMPGDGAVFDVDAFLALFSPNVAPQLALYSPYVYPGSFPQASLESLMYAGETDSLANKHVATVIENPPPELARNLGVQMLPGCAWFQVEFLMPEDPRNSLDYVNYADPKVKSQRWDMPRWTEVNANPTTGSTTYVFVPDTQANRDQVASLVDPITHAATGRLADFALLPTIDSAGAPTYFDNVESRVIRMWPYAIRITVRVFDRQGRLDQPIVRSIVHRFD